MKNYKQEAIIGSMLLKPLGLAELNKRPVFDNKYHLIATLGKTESSKTFLAQDIKKPQEKSAFKILQGSNLPKASITKFLKEYE